MRQKRKTGNRTKKLSNHNRQFCTVRLNSVTSFIRTALPAGLLFGLGAGTAFAGPEGGVVAAGEGNISTPNATTTNINQASQNIILNWESFNVNANEAVNFIQPNSQAQALNRIFDQNPSQIFGSINANGKVLLINPNGVFFKPGASVNVGGLVASGLNISDENFMNGNHHFFNADGSEGGMVVNQGLIQAATGGSVTLLGGAVKNEGTIIATAGQVNLVAGKKVTMDFDGDGLIQFAVDEEILQNVHDLDDAVSNTGTINADGGTVLLKGSAAKNVFTNVVNNSGMIGASKIENQGGVIKLVASGTSNSLINTGTLDASAADSSGGTIEIYATDTAIISEDALITTASSSDKGGHIQITGDKVGLFDNTTVDASGETGGGTVLVGGDYQGKNPDIQNASFTYIGEETSINADAITAGDGGRVIVWADNATRFYGDISAKGGSESGDGGFVEVSGKNYLQFKGNVTTEAINGNTGTLLLDPTDITIQAAGPTDIESTVAAGTETFQETTPTNTSILTTGDLVTALGSNNVVVSTVSGAAGTGNITVVDDIAYAGVTNRTLTLTAENTISLSTNANITSSTATLDVTLNSDSDNNNVGAIVMNSGSSIVSNGGNIILAGGDLTDGLQTTDTAVGEGSNIVGVLLDNATLTAGVGNIDIYGTGLAGTSSAMGIDIQNNSSISSTGGTITLVGTGGGSGTSGNTGIGISAGADITATNTATISLNGTAGTGGVNANHGINIDGSGTAITSVNGAISVTGTGEGSGSSNMGVAMSSAALIQSTGTGTITLNGTGGAGTDNYGIQLNSGNQVTAVKITSVTGDISLTGAAAGSTNSHGIVLRTGSAGSAIIESTGAADILLSGTSTNANGILTDNGGGSGVAHIIGNAAMTGDITIEATGSSDDVSLANVSITGTGNLNLRPKTASDTVGLAGGAGAFNLSVAELGFIQNGFSLITIGRVDGTGDITFGNAAGFTFNDSVKLQSAGDGGDITIAHALATGTAADTVTLVAGGTINLSTTNSDITTSNGAVVLSSDADNNAAGGAIVMAAGSSISSTGGNITLGGGNATATGDGAQGNATAAQGIKLDNADLISGGGSITLTGTGDTTINDGNSKGIQILSGSDLTAGAGAILITGTGSTNGADGVSISGSTGEITLTSSNSITINGNNKVGAFNSTYGVGISDFTTITASGAGTISITGDASAATGTEKNGISIVAGPTDGNDTVAITSNSGEITITGTAGGTGKGIRVDDNTQITSTSGNVTLSGDGVTDPGLLIANSNGGLTPQIGGGTSGNVTLKADTVNLTAASIQGSTIQLYTLTGAETIGIGGGAGTYNITDAELALFSGFSTLTIGEDTVQSGSINLQTVTSPVAAANININSNSGAGGIVLDDGGTAAALATATDLTGTGNLVLKAGTAGITANANNSFSELRTGGSITLSAQGTGEIGTSTNSLGFADGQTGVLVTTADSVYFVIDGAFTLDGATITGTSVGDAIHIRDVGSSGVDQTFTIAGNVINTNGGNSAIDLRSEGALVINSGVTINGGTGRVSLIADTDRNSTSNTAGQELVLNSTALVTSSNAGADAINLVITGLSIAGDAAMTATNATGGITITTPFNDRSIEIGGAVDGSHTLEITDVVLARLTDMASFTIGNTSFAEDARIVSVDVTAAGNPDIIIKQSTAAAKSVTLDDTGGTAINAGSGTVSITAGTNGILANANNSTAEIASSGASVTLNTTGSVGTSTNRIQFADNTNTAQQVLTIGNANTPGSAVFIDGLGELTVTRISTNNANATVTARGDLNIVDNTTVDEIGTGTGTITLAADTTAADADDNGTGTLIIGANASVVSNNTTSSAITLRGADLDINTTSGAVSASNATGGILVQATNNRNIGLGATGAQFNLIGTELQRILQVGSSGLNLSTGGTITVNGISATDSNTLDTLTLTSTSTTGPGVTFVTGASTFNTLSVQATNGIAVNTNVTTDTGNLVMDGDAGNADNGNAFDSITFGSGVTLTSEDSITLDATNDGISSAAGTLTLNAKGTTGGITINDNLTTNGVTTIDADTDNNGTGTFTFTNGTLNSNSNDVTIIANDANITATAINAGTGKLTLQPSANQTVGVGVGATGTFNISDTEIDKFTSATLEIGTTSAGNISINDITPADTDINLTLRTGGSITEEGVTDDNADITTTGSISLIAATSVGGTGTDRIDVASNTGLVVDVTDDFYIRGDGVTALSSLSVTVDTTNDTGGGLYDLSNFTGLTFGTTGIQDSTNDLSVSGIGSTSALNITIKNDAGNIILDAQDGTDAAIDLSAAGGNITVTATAGNITDANVAADNPVVTGNANLKTTGGSTVTLNASGDVGATGDGDIDVFMNGGALNLAGSATNTFVGSDGTLASLTLVDPTSYQLSGTTTVDITAGNVINRVSNSGTNFNFSYTATSGNITVGSGGANGINNIGDGNVTLTASAGSIIDANANTNTNIAAGGTITLSARDGIGSLANPLDIADSGSNNGINLSLTRTGNSDIGLNITGDTTLTGFSSGAFTGTTSITTGSSFTFAVDTIQAGDITQNATEDAGVVAGDDITVNAGVTVRSTAGNVTLNAGDNIVINNGSTVDTTGGTGTVSLSAGVADNDGSGTVQLLGTGTVASANTAGTAITINTIDLDVASTATINASGGAGSKVLIDAIDTTDTIDLGATNTLANNILEISDAELDSITAETLRIGSTAANTINVSAAISPATVTNLSLLTTNNITQAGAGTITVSGLRIDADAATTLNLANDVDTLTAVVTDGTSDFSFTDSDGFIVGTIDTQSGVRVTDGSVALVASTGNITVNNDGSAADDVSAAGAGTVSLTANGDEAFVNIATAAEVVTANGNVTLRADNIDIQGTGSINAGGTNTVFLRPFTATDAVNIGAAGDATASTLEISNAEIANITANTLQIGNTTGLLTINAATTTPNVTNVTLQADGMNLGNTLDATGGIVTLLSQSGARAFDLGSVTDVAAAVEISDTELDNITATTLRIGSTTAGAITVSAALTPANISNLSLLSDEGIGDNANAGSITLAGGLRLDVDTAVDLSTGNDVDTLAVNISGANALVFGDTDGLTIGTVDTTIGVTTANGQVDITAGGNDNTLTVSQAIASGGSAINLSADKMAIGAAVNAGAGIVTLAPELTADTDDGVNLGSGTDAAGDTIELSSAELDQITAGILRVGSTSASGNLVVSAAIAPTGTNTLSLRTGGAITQTNTITETNLAIQSVGSVTLNSANDVDNLVANVSGATNTFAFTDADDLTIPEATIESITGITTASGQIDITAGGLLTVQRNITTTGANNINLTGVGINVDTTTGGAHNVTISTTSTGNITLNAGAGTLTLQDEPAAGNEIALLTTTGTGNISIVADDLVIETNDLTNKDQIVSGGNLTLASNNGDTIGLGDDAIGIASDFRLSDSEMDALTTGGTLTIGNNNSGRILLDRVASFGANNLTLVSNSFITDNSAGNAFTSTGTLTLTSNGTIGIDNTTTNNTDLTLGIDVGTLMVIGSNGNNINVTDAGASNTIYNVVTGGAGGNVNITQTLRNAVINQINAGGTVDVTASQTTGSITDHADDALADVTAGGLITLTAGANITGFGGTDGRLDIAAGSSVNISSTTAGAINLRGLGALTLTDVDTQNGAINVTAAGLLDAVNVETITAADANDITLAATGGNNIDVDIIDTNGAGDVSLNATQIVDTGNDSLITADQLRMVATGGIGNTNGIQTEVTDVAATTTTGDIRIQEATAITINTITTAGLTITGGTAGDDIDVTTTNGTITVTSAVNSSSGGTVTLNAQGGTSNLAINNDMTSTGGLVTLSAGNNITSTAGSDITTTAAINTGNVSGAVDIDAAGTGTVSLAGNIITTGAARNVTTGTAASTAGQVDINTVDGLITVAGINASGGAHTGGNAGDNGGAAAAINIVAADGGGGDTHDVTLNGQLFSTGGTAAGAGAVGAGNTVTITADQSIIDGNATVPDITAATANLTAQTGNIDTTNTIETAVTTLTASGATGLNISNTGNVTATLTAAGGAAILNNTGTLTTGGVWAADSFDIDSTGTISIAAGHTVTSDNGAIDIRSSAGNVDIAAAVATAGAVGGTVTMRGSTGVTSTAAGTITTTGAANGTTAAGVGGTVDIDVTAAGNVALTGNIVTSGAANNTAAAGNGGQVNIDTFDGDITVADITSSGGDGTGFNDGSAGAILLTAGDNGGSNGDDITIGTLTSLAGAGAVGGTNNNVTLTALGGAIVDGNAATNNVSAALLTIDARDGVASGTTLETIVTSLDIDNTTSNNIDISNASTVAVTVTKLNNAAATGSISYTQTGNSQATLTDIDTANGDITITVNGGTGADILIGDIDADTVNDTVAITSTGAINDLAANPDTTTDVTARTITFSAVEGIGATAHIETNSAAQTAISTNGNIDIDNVAITGVTTVVTNLQTGTGTINFDQTGNEALTINAASTTAGDITIRNTGNLNADTLTIGGTVAAGGANTVSISTLTRGDIAVNNNITTGAGGTITLNSSDDITIGAFAINSGAAGGTVNLNVDTNNNVAAILDLGGSTITANDINFDGGATTTAAERDTLIGQNQANTWTLTAGNDDGTLANGGTGLTSTADFTDFHNLTGNANTDLFDFNGGSLSGNVDGQGGTDTLDYLTLAGSITVTLTGLGVTDGFAGTATNIGGSFDDIDTLAGSGNTGDTLIGRDSAAGWEIDGGNRYCDGGTGCAGRILNFSAVENLTGGTAADTFDFTVAHSGNISGGNGTNDYNLDAAIAITGNITGGTGNDTFDFNNNGATVSGTLDGGSAGTDSLDYADRTTSITVTVTSLGAGNVGFAGTATATGGFDRITDVVGSTGTDTLVGDDAASTFNLTGANSGTYTSTNALTYSSIENLTGGTAADTFNIAAGATLTGIISGGAGTDTLTQADGVNTWDITGANSGDVTDIGSFNGIENLTGGTGNDTFNVNSTLSGLINGGTAGTDTADFNVATTVTINGTNTGITNIDTVDMSGAGTLLGSAAANTWLLDTAGTGGTITVGGVTTTFQNTPTIQTGTGTDTFTNPAGGGTYTGNIVVNDSSDNRWNYTPGQQLTTGNVTGTGAFQALSAATGAVTIGAADLNLAPFNGFAGHLVVGGTILNGTTTPATYFATGATLTSTATQLTVGTPVTTTGTITLLAGDILLNSNITAGNTIGLIAAGNPALAGATGNIDASNGLVTLTAPNTADPSGAFIANNTIVESQNITLAFAGGEVDVATGSGDDIEFNGGSVFNDTSTNTNFESFATSAIVNGAALTTSLTTTFSINPASALIGLETLAFIDVGLFEEELTLFGQIGTGIAMALSQCEEQEGCAPSVSEDEMINLIETLEARLLELERRLAEESDANVRADLEELIEGFNAELNDFNGYLKELRDFFAEEDDGFDDEADEDFGDEDSLLGDADEVARLGKVLETVKARIVWLIELKANPEERARLGEAIGIELTQEALDTIIEAAKSEAAFIQNRIDLLIQAPEAKLNKASPLFTAEARDYNSMQTLHYASDLLSLNDSSAESSMNFY